MTDEQIQEIADRVIESLNNLAPGEPETWQIVAAFSPVIAAALLGLIAFLTLRQKHQADDRSEWWKRTQWALEAAASEDDIMYDYGTGMLALLAKSDLAGPDDKALLDAVWQDTETEMQTPEINHLMQELWDEPDLTEEEVSSLQSFVDGPRESSDNGPSKEADQ